MSRQVFSSNGNVTTFDPRTPRTFWLEGNSVMCACPDCGAPMTIRLWLLVADCWQCGCSVELTAEQERRIKSILKDDEQASPSTYRGHSSHSAHARVSLPHASPATVRAQPQQRPRRSALAGDLQTPPPIPMRSKSPATKPNVRDRLSQTPAWLISLLFHMALLALLALLFFENDARLEDFYITLSTEANRMNWVGGEPRFTDPNDAVQFDMPIPDPENDVSASACRNCARESRRATASRLAQCIVAPATILSTSQTNA